MYTPTTTTTIITISSNTTEPISLKGEQKYPHHRVDDEKYPDHNHEALEAAFRSLKELTKNPPPGSIKCSSPHLTPIYDKIVYRSTSQSKKIPLIIHVSFNNRCIPNELAETITRWQNNLPDHSLFFHDDDAVQRLIKGNDHDQPSLLSASLLPLPFSSSWQSSGYFPELRNHLRCVKFKNAMLIDIWRMLIIYEFGGLYTDIDNYPEPNMNSTTIRVDDSFFSLSDGKHRPSQWLFAMTPKHPIAIFTLQDISRRLLKIKNLARPRVVHITGPQTLKVAFRKFITLLEQNGTIFGNSSYYNQIQKIDLAQSDQFAKGNLGNTFDEIIKTININDSSSYDGKNYANITKRRKIELVSGIHHWTEDVKLGQPKVTSNSSQNDDDDDDDNRLPPYDGVSCIDYLAKLDENKRHQTASKKE